MFYNKEIISHYDLVVIGNSIAAVLTAKRIGDMGKSVALVTGSEMLNSEFSESQLGYISPHSPVIPALDEIGADPVLCDGKCCLPAGRSAKTALKALRESGVNLFLKALPIGLLKSGEAVKGVAVATKFGAYALKGSAVVDFSGGEYIVSKPRKAREYLFSIRLRNVSENIQLQKIQPIFGAYDIEIHKDIYDDTTYGVVFRILTEDDATQQALLIATKLCGWLRENCHGFENACMFRYARKALSTEVLENLPFEGYYHIETGDIYSADIAKAVNKAVEFAMGNGYNEPNVLSTTFGDFPLENLYTSDFLDEFLGAEISEIKIPTDNLTPINTDLFIAGLGAGGMAALKGAKTSGCSIVAAEAMPTPGGTRTHGMVSAFWHGYQGGFAIENREKFLLANREILGETAPQAIKESIYDLQFAAESKVFYSSIVFAVLKNGNDTCGALIATEKGTVKVMANKVIDATGDADLARLSGIPYMENGDHRDFVTQGFSIWGIEASGTAFPDSLYKNDDDSISTEKYTEYLRGIFLTQSRTSDYDFSPMLTVRESRRIKGKHTLCMRDILRGKVFHDTMAVSLCLYDAHGMGSSPAYYTSIFGGLKGKGTPEVVTRIPLRALLPENDEGLMVVSKAISATRDAGCLIRMNPDIQNTGFAAGVIASNAAVNCLSFESAYTNDIKNKFAEWGLLPEEHIKSSPKTAEELKKGIAEGNPQAVVAASSYPEYLSEFESDFEGEEFMAQVLGALDSPKAAAPLLQSLENALENYQGESVEATKLSTLVVLLTRLARKTKDIKPHLLPLLKRVIEVMDAGGGYGDPTLGIYQNSKVSNRIVPNFRAIMGVLIAVETLPDESLIEPLRSLKEKKNINLRDGAEIHSVQLYLRILAAAARCGDRGALEEIKTYRDSERYFFRRFAEAENTKNINAVNPRIPDPFWI